jgi:hypothetical protein
MSVTLDSRMMRLYLRVPDVRPLSSLFKLMLREILISRRVLFVPTTVLVFETSLSPLEENG